MHGLPSIFSLFYQFDKFNSTRAQMLDSIYHMTLGLLFNLISGVKKLRFCQIASNNYGSHFICIALSEIL